MSHNVTQKQLKAIRLLMRGETAQTVARMLKLRRETLSRWKKNPDFNREIEKVSNEMRSDFQLRLMHLVDASITAIDYELISAECDSKRIQMAMNIIKMFGNDSNACPNHPVQTHK